MHWLGEKDYGFCHIDKWATFPWSKDVSPEIQQVIMIHPKMQGNEVKLSKSYILALGSPCNLTDEIAFLSHSMNISY